MTKKIKLLLFDLDDTLINTHEIFVERIDSFCKEISSAHPEIDANNLKAKFNEFDIAAYSKFSVNPSRMWYTTNKLAKLYDKKYKNSFIKAYSHLHKIYETVPTLKEETISTLKKLRSDGLKIGIVTHATKKWTKIKLSRTGINKYVSKVIIADSKSFKDENIWLKATKIFNISPEETMVIGDNIKGDIISAQKSGITNTVLINSKNWSIYRSNEIPKNTVIINTLSELLSLI